MALLEHFDLRDVSGRDLRVLAHPAAAGMSHKVRFWPDGREWLGQRASLRSGTFAPANEFQN
jgi:hypothetical protein